jgi:RNA polymerase sigma factor (sigma-70 family)
MSYLSTKYSDLPCANVVRGAISTLSARYPKYALADIESVAWLTYHNFMAGKGADLKGDKLAGTLFVVIRRRVMDELRRVDPLSRHSRTLSNRLRRTREELERVLGREPTIEEIAKGAGVRLSAATKALEAASAEAAVANSTVYNFDSDSIGPLSTLITLDDPTDEVIAIEAATVVSDEMSRLPPLAQRILRLHCMEGATVAEVARETGESVFRVAKIRDGALTALRSRKLIKEIHSSM